MIVVASYTANLAAFLVLNPREDFTISGVEVTIFFYLSNQNKMKQEKSKNKSFQLIFH